MCLIFQFFFFKFLITKKVNLTIRVDVRECVGEKRVERLDREEIEKMKFLVARADSFSSS